MTAGLHLVDSASALPLRFHRLRQMSKSPAHFAAAIEPAETAPMETGTAADELLLGHREVLAYPGEVRRGKAYDDYCAEHPGALILTQREAVKTFGICTAVLKCSDAMRVLEGARRETLYWEFAGRLCRGTPDVRGDGFLTDLKTGETSDPRQFPWKVKRYAYHAQLSWYETGCGLLGHPITESYIVAVEQLPPHVVTVFRLTPNLIEMGARLWRSWLEQLLVCEASGEFPPYSQSVVDLDLPDDSDIDLSDAVEVVESTR